MEKKHLQAVPTALKHSMQTGDVIMRFCNLSDEETTVSVSQPEVYIYDPYDTMTLNLDMRKNSYASKAHEASANILHRIMKEKGDIFRYYNTDGKIRVYNVNKTAGPQVVEFYIESMDMPDAVVQKENGEEIGCQVSPHPRGRRITFVDTFAAGEEKTYTYRRKAAEEETLNTRQCYSGSERVRDIVNTYDPETYHLPYYFENDFFKLSYRVGEGIRLL